MANKQQSKEEIEEIKKQMRDLMNVVTPKHLYDYLNQHVIGQYEAKKLISVAVYNHYKRFCDSIYGYTNDVEDNPYKDVTIEKSNVICAGPTGCGKTYMLRMLAKYLNIPFYISDASGLTQAGYVGDDVENCVLGALRDCNFNVQAAQHAIIVLDEFDKLSRKGESTSITRDVGGEGVQQSLLKLVEGYKVQVPPNGGRKHPEQECIEVDTTNILFFGIGAFEGLDKIIERRKNKKTIGFNNVMNNGNADNEEEDLLSDITTEDLKKFGIIPELIGRFPLVTHVKPLTEEEMYQVLTEPKNSIIKQYQKMMWIDNIDLVFEEQALKLIAKNASEKKTGARALRGVIDKVLAELMFEYGGYNEKKIKLVVTEEMVNKYIEDKEILGKKVA
jgi:ATP-dependent Clp protease ATP-binding subunit ClpX